MAGLKKLLSDFGKLPRGLIKSLSSLTNKYTAVVKKSLSACRKSLLALKKFLSEQNWAVSADRFPLLLLALLWSLGALCYQ
ncbi:MAG: hypothetical protein ACOYMG_28700, partial [Candidatus Methylumidiphilus sp.]